MHVITHGAPHWQGACNAFECLYVRMGCCLVGREHNLNAWIGGSGPLFDPSKDFQLTLLDISLGMRFFTKIFRAGEISRKSRFHTFRDEIIPLKEFFELPVELLLRLFYVKRSSPWLPKSAVKALEALLKKEPKSRVLEIGGGSSSKFFADRADFLLTIEEDPEWALMIRDSINKNIDSFQIEVVQVSEWLKTRTPTNMNFDIVLIDGAADEIRKRALITLSALNPRAIYILDNSDRIIFREINFTRSPKKIVRYKGLLRNPFQANETTFYWFQ